MFEVKWQRLFLPVEFLLYFVQVVRVLVKTPKHCF